VIDNQQGINGSHQDNVMTRPLDLLTHIKEAGQEYGSPLQGSPFQDGPIPENTLRKRKRSKICLFIGSHLLVSSDFFSAVASAAPPVPSCS
jgi:hypothetical protein